MTSAVRSQPNRLVISVGPGFQTVWSWAQMRAMTRVSLIIGHGIVYRGLVRAQAGRLVLPPSQQSVAFLGDGGHQGLEGFGKLAHTLAQQLLGDGVQVHAQLGQASQLGAGLVQISFQRKRDGAVIAEGVEGSRRHSVDRIRPDEAVHIEGVRVGRVLGAGAGPQGALDASPLRGQALPALATGYLSEAGVGHFGVGDGDLSLKVFGIGYWVLV